jgi:hypothetical protein
MMAGGLPKAFTLIWWHEHMVTSEQFRASALRLPESEEKSHFGKADFRVKNKIFAGFDDKGRAYVKLKPEQQEFVCDSEKPVVRPIPGGWGKQGWTEIDHVQADEMLVKSLLTMAWTNVAPKTLLKSHSQMEGN